MSDRWVKGFKSMRDYPSLKLTFSHLKMDGWNTSFILGWPIFRFVCFRGCMKFQTYDEQKKDF